MKYIDSEKLIALIDSKLEDLGLSGSVWVGRSVLQDLKNDIITSLQQERPEVDLEKEIEKGWEKLEKDYSPSALDKSYIIVSGLVGREQFSLITRHFYNLGLNNKK